MENVDRFNGQASFAGYHPKQLSKHISNLLAEGYFDHAAVVTRENVTEETKDHFLLFQAAKIALHFKKPEQAKQYLGRALCTKADDSYSLQLLGDIFAEEKNYNEALALYQRALVPERANSRGKPQNVVGKICTMLLMLGRGEEALAAAEDRIRLDPGDPYGWGHKCTALLALGRYEELPGCLEALKKIDPDSNYFLLWEGRIAIHKNDAATALKSSGVLMRKEFHPSHMFFFRALAVLGYVKKEQYDSVYFVLKQSGVISKQNRNFDIEEDTDIEDALRHLDRSMAEESFQGKFQRPVIFRTDQLIRPLTGTAADVARNGRRKWRDPKPSKIVSPADSIEEPTLD